MYEEIENASTYTEMVALFEETGIPYGSFEPTHLGGELEGGVNAVSFTPGQDLATFNNYVNVNALTYAVEKNGFSLWKQSDEDVTTYTAIKGPEGSNVFLQVASDSVDNDIAFLNRSETTCAIIDDYVSMVKTLDFIANLPIDNRPIDNVGRIDDSDYTSIKPPDLTEEELESIHETTGDLIRRREERDNVDRVGFGPGRITHPGLDDVIDETDMTPEELEKIREITGDLIRRREEQDGIDRVGKVKNPNEDQEEN